MKTHFGIMFALGVLCTLLVSCGDDGEGRKPNIFGDEESFVKVEYSSNADTVYLRWTLTDKDTRFDSYEVTDNRTGRVVTPAARRRLASSRTSPMPNRCRSTSRSCRKERP